MPVEHRDFVAVLRQVPRGRDTDHARAQDEDAHQAARPAPASDSASSSSASGMQLQKRLRSPYTLSTRATGGQYFTAFCAAVGYAADRRE